MIDATTITIYWTDFISITWILFICFGCCSVANGSVVIIKLIILIQYKVNNNVNYNIITNKLTYISQALVNVLELPFILSLLAS